MSINAAMTIIVAILMAYAAFGKRTLEHKWRRRICGVCGRNFRGKRCRCVR